ncbi:DUF262 domain-containing protein [Clostridium sartagoforme]|uniref:DUF262 domain-containing protein n=1 Tax=Clostridium sartagoforme TaxID=84031 RepID=UPI0031E2D80E
MSDNKYSLYRLLENYEVRIPIIQRDYAQGRNNDKANEVRKNIIRDIVSCLESSNKAIDFNFVYGNVSKDNIVFFPVDGQQRLTTLYLLHWFLAVCGNKVNDFKRLKRFSYMTRNSASEFFDLLKETTDELLTIVKDNKDIRIEIENQPWYQIEWSNDPTVDAALTMLNDFSQIESLKNNAEFYYNKLINDSSCITFSLILENADDAENKAAQSYIRMNARGKTLEPFENLKAMIDSIDEGIDSPTELIKSYDESHINALHKTADGGSLTEKTKSINKRSMNCFKNLYNLCCQLKDNNSIKKNEVEYISSMYEYSQNQNDENSIFFKFYFNLVQVTLDYYTKKYVDDEDYERYEEDIYGLNDIFKVDGDGFIASDNRNTVAEILYAYYYKCKHNDLPTLETIKLFLYLLNNLNYMNWNLYLSTIESFVKMVSDETDVFEYFIKHEIVDIFKVFDGKDVLDDIKVRLKEQKIKIMIIEENNIETKYYFSSYESRTYNKKIQYLLYISGYWDGQGNYNELTEYLKFADEWFMNSDNDLEWRRYYAIANNLNTQGNQPELLGAEEINQKCGESHIWKDEYYFWNDSSDNNLVQLPALEIIKKAYKNKANIDGLKKILIEDNRYDACWIKYCIKYNYKQLLNQVLHWNNSDSSVYISVSGVGKKKYMLYVLGLEKKANWGIVEFQMRAKDEYRFEANKSYEVPGLPPFYIGDRAYVLRLESPVKITGRFENFNSESCVYTYGQDHKYIVYEYQPNTPNLFKVFQYDMNGALNTLNNNYNRLVDEIKKYKLVDYLEIKNYKKNDWVKYDRGSTWVKKEEKIQCDVIPINSITIL